MKVISEIVAAVLVLSAVSLLSVGCHVVNKKPLQVEGIRCIL